MSKYRSRAECRDIVRAIIAESAPPPVASFNLSQSEENFFRRRTARAIERAGKDTCVFTEYYALPMARPVRNLVLASAVMIAAALAATGILYAYSPAGADQTRLFSGSLAVIVAAVGWVVAGGFNHRNTIRQATNNMLFARFTTGPVNEAFYRFGRAFGYNQPTPVTPRRLAELRASDSEDDWKAASSVGFLLNYFELIANGVIRGDLDHRIVRDTIRGVIVYYYDRCEPFIRECVDDDPRTYEQLRRLRAHYREP